MADEKSKPKSRWRRVLRGVLRIAITLYAGLFLFALFFSNSVIFAPQPSSYQDAPDILKLTTRDGTKISAMYLPNDKATFTILYSHGNAEDIGEMLPELRLMSAMGFRFSPTIITATAPAAGSRRRMLRIRTSTPRTCT